MRVLVTGAWGYSGGRITAELAGPAGGGRHQVWSLTRRAPKGGAPDPWNGAVEAVEPPETPDGGWDRDELARIIRERETDAVVCNYWSRHDAPPRGHRGPWAGHFKAEDRCGALVDAAESAGVKLFVYTGITNPGGGEGRLSYFRGKLAVENRVRRVFSARNYAVLRPACFFGNGGPPGGHAPGILVENIAWACRVVPVAVIPEGRCLVRPIHVDDFARLAARTVDRAAEGGGIKETTDACGTWRGTLEELFNTVGEAVGRKPKVVKAGGGICRRWYKLAGYMTGETVLSDAELEGLRLNLLDSTETPVSADGHIGTPETELARWCADRGGRLGRRLAREPRR